MGNILSEMEKNTLDGINTRLDFEEGKISEFEATALETIQNKTCLPYNQHHTLRYPPKRRKTYLHEDLNIQSFVQNNKELETTQTSIG